MEYRREIDGLRAIAVMSVVLFHAGFSTFSGGYVGVDVFFVISGYLITNIILLESNAGTFSMARFYERRAKRILPALYVVVGCCLPLAWLWMMPGQLESFLKSIAATFFFVSNLYFREELDYFAPAADEQVLLHTWSLAVEEQFYLLVPVFLALFWKQGLKRLMWITITIAFVSFVISVRGTLRHPEENFFVAQSRAWELLIGSILAFCVQRGFLQHPILQHRLPPVVQGVLASTGLLSILLAVVWLDEQTPVPGYHALLPTLGAAAVIAFANPSNLAGRLLAWRLPVAIGLASYSIYLWHFPLFAFARIRFDYAPGSLLQGALVIGLTLLLATLSYRFVEQPFRKMSFVRTRLFATVSGLMVLALLVAGAGIKTDGFPGRLSDAQRQRLQVIETATREKNVDDGRCVFNVSVVDAAFASRFLSCANSHGKALVVLGDSHGEDLFNAVARNTNRPFVVGLTKGGCRPHYPKPGCHYPAAAAFLLEHRHWIDAVFYKQEGNQFLEKHRKLPIQQEAIQKTLDYLMQLSPAIRIVWLGPHAEPDIDLRNLNILFRYVTLQDKDKENPLIADVDRALIEQGRKRGLEYISLLALIDYSFERDFFVDGQYTYSDTNHWSMLGERYFGQRLLNHDRLRQLIIAENR